MSDMVECLRKQGRHDIADEIERLRDRITELQATIAAMRGTIARAYEEDEPSRIEHDIPPNAPR